MLHKLLRLHIQQIEILLPIKIPIHASFFNINIMKFDITNMDFIIKIPQNKLFLSLIFFLIFFNSEKILGLN